MGALALPISAHVLSNSSVVAVRYQSASSASASMGGHSLPTPIAFFRILDASHPTMRHPSDVCGQLHASIKEWGTVSQLEGDDAPVHQFPHAFYYLDGMQVRWGLVLATAVAY